MGTQNRVHSIFVTLATSIILGNLHTVDTTFADEFVHIKVHLSEAPLKVGHRGAYRSTSSTPFYKVIHHYHHGSRKNKKHTYPIIDAIVLSDSKYPYKHVNYGIEDSKETENILPILEDTKHNKHLIAHTASENHPDEDYSFEKQNQHYKHYYRNKNIHDDRYNVEINSPEIFDNAQHTTSEESGLQDFSPENVNIYQTDSTEIESGRYKNPKTSNAVTENSSSQLGYHYSRNVPTYKRPKINDHKTEHYDRNVELVRPLPYSTKSYKVMSKGYVQPWTETNNDQGYDKTDFPVSYEEAENKKFTYSGIDSYSAGHVQGVGSPPYIYSAPFL